MAGPVNESLNAAMRKAVSALQREEIPHLLGGGYAVYARGGPAPDKDVDLVVRPADAERALEALAGEGMRTERPSEGWLYKAWDGDVLVDLIFEPSGLASLDGVFDAAERLTVDAQPVDVMALEDVLVTKVMALDEHSLDYGHLIAIARSLREQIDWQRLHERTADSPYSRAFFTLARDLEIAPADAIGTRRGTTARIV